MRNERLMEGERRLFGEAASRNSGGEKEAWQTTRTRAEPASLANAELAVPNDAASEAPLGFVFSARHKPAVSQTRGKEEDHVEKWKSGNIRPIPSPTNGAEVV
jgi:hypothetical protein